MEWKIGFEFLDLLASFVESPPHFYFGSAAGISSHALNRKLKKIYLDGVLESAHEFVSVKIIIGIYFTNKSCCQNVLSDYPNVTHQLFKLIFTGMIINSVDFVLATESCFHEWKESLLLIWPPLSGVFVYLVLS